jgi:hypothetical protein
VRVPAGDGTTAQDYTFSWHERDVVGPGHTIVTLGRKPRPKSVLPEYASGTVDVGEYLSSAVTYVFIWALKADGTPATNVGWARNSAVPEVTNGSRRLRAIEVSRHGDHWDAENVTRSAPTRPVPRMDVQCGSYAAANLEFTGSVLDLGATPTETVEFVAVAAVPNGVGSVFEVRNDADSAWLPFTDGQTAAEVGVSQRQTYKVRWRASPNTETDATPTLFEIGVRDVKRVWLSDIATVKATWSIPDLAELVPAIPEAEIVVQKNGEQDFFDRITVLLSENYVGSLAFRVWVGDISRPRSEWVHKDDFVLVDDYDPRDPDVTVIAHSPLVLLNGVLPVYNTTTQQQTALRLASKTPTQVWDEIIGVQLATDVPVKYRGDISALGSSVLLTKNITDSDGKTELDAIAHIAGCVIGSTRGKIAAFDMFTPGGIKAVFPAEKIKWRSMSPGLRQRVPEFFAKYDYQDETQNYRGNARVITVDANTLTRMGGTARIDANRNLRDEVCRWVPTEKIAKAIGQRRVNALGTGMLLWRFTSNDPYPELEFGDRVAVETRQFMARDPTLGTLRALKGALWAIGRVVEYDVEGRELAIWIQGYADILGAGSSAAVRLGLGLPGPLGQNFTQMLANPGFEDGFVFWARNAGADATVILDATKARTGNSYLQVTSAAGVRANAVAVDNTGGFRYFEVNPGDVVQWGGYAYRESGTDNVTLLLQTLDKDKVALVNNVTPAQNTAAWASVESQLVIPAGVKFVKLFCDCDGTGTATVARFDDVFLRMAVADSTVLNPQGSVLPIALAGFLNYTTSQGTAKPWIAFDWTAQAIPRPDGSTLTIPVNTSMNVPGTPTLTEITTPPGVTALATGFVYTARVGYIKNQCIVGISASASINHSTAGTTVAVNVPAPPAGTAYDGWCVLIDDVTNPVVLRYTSTPGSNTLRWPSVIDPCTVYGSAYALDIGGMSAATAAYDASWNTKCVVSHPYNNGAVLAYATAYTLYPFFDFLCGVVVMAGACDTAANPTLAGIQQADAHYPLGGAGAGLSPSITVTTPAFAAGVPVTGNNQGGRNYK